MLMKTDELGIPRFSNRDLINMIYSGHADKMHAVLCEKETNTENLLNQLYEIIDEMPIRQNEMLHQDSRCD